MKQVQSNNGPQFLTLNYQEKKETRHETCNFYTQKHPKRGSMEKSYPEK